MSANPFHYGTPVEGEQFTGREQELAALTSRMRDGINVVLLSPRRYGKTSLLLRAEAQLARSRPTPAVVRANVLRSLDLAALVGQLTTAAYQQTGGRWHRTKQAVPDFLKRLRLRPTVTVNEHGHPVFSFESGLVGPNADTVLVDLFDLLEELAADRPAVVVLDEFQAIVDHGAHLPNLLKSVADSHASVCLVMAGSKRHLMERLVTTEGAPLYGMAQKLALGPIPGDLMARFLCDRAAAGGKLMTTSVGRRVVDLAGPVPNDIQRLAYEAFEVAGSTIDDQALTSALEQAVAHEAATHAETFAARSPGQRRVLATLADGGRDQVFSASFARQVGLAGSSSVTKAIDALVGDELVADREGRWQVTDPFFAAWLRHDPV